MSGKGAQSQRAEHITRLFTATTKTEQLLLLRLLSSEPSKVHWAGPRHYRDRVTSIWGVLSITTDYSRSPFLGLLPEVPASRVGNRGINRGVRTTTAHGSLQQLCGRKTLGHFLVKPAASDLVLMPHHLRFRRSSASGVVAACAARLPSDIHASRSHCVAHDRHLNLPSGHASTRNLAVCRSRQEANVRPAHCSRSCWSPSHAAHCPESTPRSHPGQHSSCCQMWLFSYGGILIESFIAVIALITTSIINQNLYFHPQRTGRTNRQHRGNRRRVRQ